MVAEAAKLAKADAMTATKPKEKPGTPKEDAAALPVAHESTAAARLKLKLSAVTAAHRQTCSSISKMCYKPHCSPSIDRRCNDRHFPATRRASKIQVCQGKGNTKKA